jgi:hypothetical protein
LLYHDDDVCQRYLVRWFNDHRVAAPMMLYDDAGRYLFRASGKIAIVARALTESIARARDNELFVLLVDLLDVDADRTPLLKAVKTARARHHQVQLICPWPPGVPLPEGRERPPPVFMATDLQELLSRVWTGKLHQAYFDLRREFGRIGVPTIAAPNEQTVAQVLERMQRLRPGARRTR